MSQSVIVKFFILSSKFTKSRLSGLCPDPLGSLGLHRSPKPSNCISGKERKERGRDGKIKKEEKGGASLFFLVLLYFVRSICTCSNRPKSCTFLISALIRVGRITLVQVSSLRLLHTFTCVFSSCHFQCIFLLTVRLFGCK